MQSGVIVWCNRGGAYSSARGVGIARSCLGKVNLAAADGRAQQLRRLRKGRRPKTRAMLPSAVSHGEVDIISIQSQSFRDT